MKKLIVNADDFGLTEGVNRAILGGHHNGIITSATLMANGPAFDSAVVACLAAPALSVGVHLNLTHGRPVSRLTDVPSLVTPDGCFYPSPAGLVQQILTRRVRLAEVERELRSQIDKVASAGVRITHLDSHKHIHVVPQLLNIVLNLAREYGIRCIRCPIEPASSALDPVLGGGGRWLPIAKQYLLGRVLSALAALQVKKVTGAGLQRTEGFYGLSHTGFLDSKLLEKLLRELPEGTSELMCHPGYVDGDLLQTRTRLRTQRETELEALTSPNTRALIAELGIELITYDKLLPAADPAGRKCNETLHESTRRG